MRRAEAGRKATAEASDGISKPQDSGTQRHRESWATSITKASAFGVISIWQLIGIAGQLAPETFTLNTISAYVTWQATACLATTGVPQIGSRRQQSEGIEKRPRGYREWRGNNSLLLVRE